MVRKLSSPHLLQLISNWKSVPSPQGNIGEDLLIFAFFPDAFGFGFLLNGMRGIFNLYISNFRSILRFSIVLFKFENFLDPKFGFKSKYFILYNKVMSMLSSLIPSFQIAAVYS